jgi:hypothetical protein
MPRITALFLTLNNQGLQETFAIAMVVPTGLHLLSSQIYHFIVNSYLFFNELQTFET